MFVLSNVLIAKKQSVRYCDVRMRLMCAVFRSRNASWMKSINFKCLTTAISVDGWERVEEKQLWRGANALCWKPKHQIIQVKKTAFDRWKELITAPMRSQMPQNASRVDDNNTIHRLLICNNNTRERKKKWNRKENCSRYSFYPWTFWGRRFNQTCETNTQYDWQHKRFCGVFFFHSA